MTINKQCRNCRFLEMTPCETPLFWCECPSKKEVNDHIGYVKFDAEGCSAFENPQTVFVILSSSAQPTQTAPSIQPAPPIQLASPLPTPKKSLEDRLIKGVAMASLMIVAAKILGGEIPSDWQKTVGTFFSGASGTGTLVASFVGVTAGMIARWIKL